MFMAFSSSLRSSDLARQVGAVIARNNEIIASGANDSPKAGGGLYWSTLDSKDVAVIPGRDFERGVDPNMKEKREIIENILDAITGELAEGETNKVRRAIEDSPIKDIIEFNRAVHAEMEALMMCARNNTMTVGASLFVLHFPATIVQSIS